MKRSLVAAALAAMLAACGSAAPNNSTFPFTVPPGGYSNAPTASPTAPATAPPIPTTNPSTAWAVHMVTALDELVTIRSSQGGVSNWASTEADWLKTNAAGVLSVPPFATYYEDVIAILQAILDGKGLPDKVTAILALRSDIAQFAIGLVPAEAPVPTFYLPGEPVTVSVSGDPWAVITLSKVSSHTKYVGTYSTDRPARGSIYIQVWVQYEALIDGVNYNPYDWTIYAADSVIADGVALVLEGPSPELQSGTLPKGRKVAGWIVLEVPVTGQVLMSYDETGGAPVFEVEIRAR